MTAAGERPGGGEPPVEKPPERRDEPPVKEPPRPGRPDRPIGDPPPKRPGKWA